MLFLSAVCEGVCGGMERESRVLLLVHKLKSNSLQNSTPERGRGGKTAAVATPLVFFHPCIGDATAAA